MTTTTTQLSPEEIEKYGWTPMPRSFTNLLENITQEVTPHIDTLAIPQTPLASRIQQYAQTQLPVQTYNHSMRVYHFGKSIISQHFPHLTPILETYFLACMLHDIGTTEENIEKTALSFEFWGGMEASRVLEKEGAEKFQREAVVEAVIRHQDLGETGMVQSLEAVLMLATVFDNIGLNPQLIHKDTIEHITQAFPRLKWSGCFADTIRKELALKPWAHTSAIESFAEKVEGNELMEPWE